MRYVMSIILSLYITFSSAQILTVNIITKLHTSNLGYQNDLGFLTNSALTFVLNDNQFALFITDNQDFNYTENKAYNNSNYTLFYNKLFFNDSKAYFNYFGIGVNFNNQIVKQDNNILSKNQLYGAAINVGLGINVNNTIFQVGTVFGADLIGIGYRRYYSTFYFSAGFKLLSFNKKK